MNLHVVSFDIPYPPNYGGIVDVYNKLRILNKLEINIILHLFHKGDPDKNRIEHLHQYCSKINLYKRNTTFFLNFSAIPFIVAGRADKKLLNNLKTDMAPILFEGLHSSYYLSHKDLRNRKKIVRMHNIEWQYYESLMKGEMNFIKKLFYRIEARKLKKFEKVIQFAQNILAISPLDYDYLLNEYKNLDISYIPPFHFTDILQFKSKRGDYILFHGDLSINDTENVIIELIDKVLKSINISVKIAGKNPSKSLTKAISGCSNIELIENPIDKEMQSLIQNAHIILVYSGIKAGMKLKLLNGLYQGRFIVGDNNSIKDTGVEDLCFIENNYNSLTHLLNEIWQMDYTEKINMERTILLNQVFSNINNGTKLLNLIQG